MLVKEGGTLILVTPAPKGIAPDHPQLIALGTTPGSQALARVERGEISDGVAAATYLALDQTRRRVNIILVSDGITQAEANRIGLAATPDLASALASALARHGDGARVGVVTHGADIMGRFK